MYPQILIDHVYIMSSSWELCYRWTYRWYYISYIANFCPHCELMLIDIMINGQSVTYLLTTIMYIFIAHEWLPWLQHLHGNNTKPCVLIIVLRLLNGESVAFSNHNYYYKMNDYLRSSDLDWSCLQMSSSWELCYQWTYRWYYISLILNDHQNKCWISTYTVNANDNYS